MPTAPAVERHTRGEGKGRMIMMMTVKGGRGFMKSEENVRQQRGCC